MSDTGSAVGGLALIVGLFVTYAVQRRALKRAKNVPKPILGMNFINAAPEPAPPARASRSPNWGAPIVFCLLLLGAATHRGNFWGYLWQAIFLALVGIAVYSMFSTKDFEIERKRDPEITKAQHYVTVGVPYVLFPMIGWTMVVPFGWNAGAIVPALAWVPLVLIAIGVGVVEKLRNRSM